MLDSLKRFLKYIEMPILSNNKYEIHLKDTNALTKKNYCFKITNVPENTLVIRADKFPNMKHFFKDDEDIGLCKKSDYIIISIDKHSNYKVLIVEISSGDNKSNIFIRQQLKGATCILKYYESICKYYKEQYPSCRTTGYGRYGSQYIISWARLNIGAKVALVELPLANSMAEALSMKLPEKYITATLNYLRAF